MRRRRRGGDHRGATDGQPREEEKGEKRKEKIGT
jgi:hypothetical protein